MVDEGHRLKNFNSKLFRDLRQLNVESKLLLTGGLMQLALLHSQSDPSES